MPRRPIKKLPVFESVKDIRLAQKKSYKLNHYEQLQFVKKLACFENNSEIKLWFESIGKPVDHPASLAAVYKNSEKWKPVIEKYRAEFNSQLADIPIANKVKRLQEMDQTYWRMIDLEDKSFKNEDRMSAVDKQLKILSQAQGELEGKNMVEHNNLYFTQFNNMSPKEFDEFRLKLIDKVQRYQKVIPQEFTEGEPE